MDIAGPNGISMGHQCLSPMFVRVCIEGGASTVKLHTHKQTHTHTYSQTTEHTCGPNNGPSVLTKYASLSSCGNLGIRRGGETVDVLVYNSIDTRVAICSCEVCIPRRRRAGVKTNRTLCVLDAEACYYYFILKTPLVFL